MPQLISTEGNRIVQGVQQSQTAALPRHQEEEETDKSKQVQIKHMKSTKISSLFPKRDCLRTASRVNHRGFKALLQLANFTLGPDATLNTEIHKIRFA